MADQQDAEYYLDVNIARGLVAAFEAVTKVWQYPDDDLIRCKPVKAPVLHDGNRINAMFDLFLPDGRSAEVDMVGSRRNGHPAVWKLREARFFLPCVCGRIHPEARIDHEGNVVHASTGCTVMRAAALEQTEQAS